jgi:hypothetical protein
MDSKWQFIGVAIMFFVGAVIGGGAYEVQNRAVAGCHTRCKAVQCINSYGSGLARFLYEEPCFRYLEIPDDEGDPDEMPIGANSVRYIGVANTTLCPADGSMPGESIDCPDLEELEPEDDDWSPFPQTCGTECKVPVQGS